jgi:membrane protease YdiL (CAAX protease family)
MEPLGVAGLVTALVTALSATITDQWVATAVGLTFFGATWVTVWRRDDAVVTHCGLSFAGLVLPGEPDALRVAREAAIATGWALLLAIACFLPFYVGFRAWAQWMWHVRHPFLFVLRPARLANDLAAQLLIVALPEEAFYRGYLQTRLDDAWPPSRRWFGAPVGPAILCTSAVFALGHVATIHDPGRLAVFFPSLAFGWLRARTGGVGAPLAFHALCNLFSESLMSGYGFG